MNTHAFHHARWRKSSYYKGQDDCLEITGAIPGQVGIRDSELSAASPIPTVTTAGWHGLIAAIRAAELGDGPS